MKKLNSQQDIQLPTRRAVLAYSVGALAAATAMGRLLAAEPKPGEEVSIEQFAADGSSQGVVPLPKVVKTEAEWRKQLSADSYQVTRHENTEAPFSGAYNNNHKDGLYRCICCDTALYDSKNKFESGTGWPSFWKPISTHNINKIKDNSLGMQRIAVACSRCDAHLGHVFDDGPKPTGLRYCMNSVALNFVVRA